MILLIAMFPFWWMINTSLKQQVDIFGGVTLYPHNPTTANYSRLFNTYHFADYLRNSILIVTVSVAVSLVLGTLAAYPLARFHLRLRAQPVGAGGGAAGADAAGRSCW